VSGGRTLLAGPEAAAEAAAVCRAGGVVVYPTETVYGLGCDPFQAQAVARVRAVKGRDALKPMLAVTDAWPRAERWFAEVPAALAPVLEHEPPLAVTVVLPAGPAAPEALVSAEGTVAVRRSSDPFVAALVAATGAPVLSTSANRAGEPPASGFAALDPAVLSAVDLAVDAGRPLGGTPSTVVTVREGALVVLREGAVPLAALQALVRAG